MDILQEKLLSFAKNNLNVLLLGSHGIGKTERVLQISKQLNYKFKYYSASTLDPFADIVGIPVPNKDKKVCEFFRPQDLEEAEFLMFDELNRAHPRVLNAVLEIIQFKTVNGVKLPNLKMIWAAINPPGENYQVEELDPALLDRFHCYVPITPELNLEFLKSRITEEIATALKVWWDTNLDKHQQKILTPRRIEYIGLMIDKGLSWRSAMPQGHQFPVDFLESKINKIKNGTVNQDEIETTKENIISNPSYFKQKVKEDPRLFTKMSEIIRNFNAFDLFSIRDLLECFPQDLIENLSRTKFPAVRSQFKEFFEQKKIDLSLYPKISKSFQWVPKIP